MFFASVMDYFFFGAVIEVYHFFGMIAIFAGTLFVSFSDSEDKTHLSASAISNIQYDPDMPLYVPVFFAIITAFWFSINQIFLKHVLDPQKKYFDAATLSFSSGIVCNALVLLVGVFWYWRYVEEFN